MSEQLSFQQGVSEGQLSFDHYIHRNCGGVLEPVRVPHWILSRGAQKPIQSGTEIQSRCTRCGYIGHAV